MDLKFRKSGNEEYDFLIQKGFKYFEIDSDEDAYQSFRKAQDIIIDPCEAFFGLAIYKARRDFKDNRRESYYDDHGFKDDFKKNVISKWVILKLKHNLDYEKAKKLCTDKNKEFKSIIEKIDSLYESCEFDYESATYLKIIRNEPGYHRTGDYRNTITFIKKNEKTHPELQQYLDPMYAEYFKHVIYDMNSAEWTEESLEVALEDAKEVNNESMINKISERLDQIELDKACKNLPQTHVIKKEYYNENPRHIIGNTTDFLNSDRKKEGLRPEIKKKYDEIVKSFVETAYENLDKCIEDTYKNAYDKTKSLEELLKLLERIEKEDQNCEDRLERHKEKIKTYLHWK